MTPDIYWQRIEEVEAAMPSYIPNAYEAVRSFSPKMWANLRQYHAPRMVAIGIVQYFDCIDIGDPELTKLIDHLRAAKGAK